MVATVKWLLNFTDTKLYCAYKMNVAPNRTITSSNVALSLARIKLVLFSFRLFCGVASSVLYGLVQRPVTTDGSKP